MKIEPFEIDGLWFLPGEKSREKRVSGRLVLDQDHNLELFLNGTLGEEFPRSFPSNKPTIYSIVHGIANNSPLGRLITLKDCHQSGLSLSFPGYSTEKLFCTTAYAGHCLLEPDDFEFDSCIVAFDSLDKWFYPISLSVNREGMLDQSSELVIKYANNPDIQISHPRCDINIRQSTRINESRYDGATVSTSVDIALSIEKPKSLDGIWAELISPVRHFLTLATGDKTAITEVHVGNQEIANVAQHGEKVVSVLGGYGTSKSNTKLHSPHEMLLHASSFSPDELRSLIVKWLDFHEKYIAFCTHYFNSQYRDYPYIDLYFNSLVRSMVAYFRTNQSNLVAEHNLTTTREIFLDDAWRNFPSFLSSELLRLKNLFEPISSLPAPHFVQRVVATVNSINHPHGSGSMNSHIIRGNDYLNAISNLQILCNLWMLEGLGFDAEDAGRIISQTPTYMYRKIASDAKGE